MYCSVRNVCVIDDIDVTTNRFNFLKVVYCQSCVTVLSLTLSTFQLYHACMSVEKIDHKPLMLLLINIIGCNINYDN